MAREKAHRERIKGLEAQLKEIENRVQRDTDDESGRYLEQLSEVHGQMEVLVSENQQMQERLE